MSVIQQQPKWIQVENAICCNAFYFIFLYYYYWFTFRLDLET